jgi:hypothetical protein
MVQGAIAGFVGSVDEVRGNSQLNSRYDDLKAAAYNPLDGDDAFQRLRLKEREPPRMSGFALHPETLDDLNEVFNAADRIKAADGSQERSSTACVRLFLFHVRASPPESDQPTILSASEAERQSIESGYPLRTAVFGPGAPRSCKRSS